MDGSQPFRAETAQSYVQGVLIHYYQSQQREGAVAAPVGLPIQIESRFRYNQDFKSVFALMPGSISSLYTSPAWVGEFLLGKQIPYVVLSFVSFPTLVLLAIFHFDLTIKGSTAGLMLARLLYVFATTAFGILVSSFTRTQVAALITTAVLTQVPVLSFSGFLSPAAALDGGPAFVGQLFPAFYFQNISVGSFAKAREITDLAPDFIGMAVLGADEHYRGHCTCGTNHSGDVQSQSQRDLVSGD